VPVPLFRPCAESDDNVLPVQMVSHWGGAQSGGSETPVSVQVFKKTFLQSHFFKRFWLQMKQPFFLTISEGSLSRNCGDIFILPAMGARKKCRLHKKGNCV
jgi:hypothetical protein